MKKYYVLLIALLMVSVATGQRSIPVLSNDAFVKSNHPVFNLQHPTPNSMRDVQGKMMNKEWETSDINQKRIWGKASNIKHSSIGH